MQDIINADRLPPEVEKAYLPYLKKLLEFYPKRIVSVFVYGSATGVNYISGVSDITSVCVFEQLSWSDVQNALAIVRKKRGSKIVVPLFLTKEYIRSSLDVFPIEFLDMKENHVLLYGEDVLSLLEIKGQYLRLFCEQELKGRFIRIRQAYLEIGLQHNELANLLRQSLNSLMPIFRNLLRLRKKRAPIDKIEIIVELCREFSLDEKDFMDIYRHLSGDQKIPPRELAVSLSEYLEEIEKLIFAVDRL